MGRTRIKVCGVTRAEDAAFAAGAGVDFLGFNFLAGPRRIDVPTCAAIIEEAAGREPLTRSRAFVGLCAVSSAGGGTPWTEFAPHSHLRPLQIYGEDYAPLADEHMGNQEWWMVRSVSSRASLGAVTNEYGRLRRKPTGVLLDTAVKGQLGGTGKTFDWTWIAEARAAGELDGLPPIVLAGGLTPENVGEAIRVARPWAVDVSSGVEAPGKPGVKDPARVRAFIEAVRAADEA
jgi:phosphoribosylanthranilate isomerase